jgi:hypothetical protein
MLFARACGRRLRSADELLGAFWPGLALALVFLMLWHFFFPVNQWAAACVLGAGWLGLAAGLKRLRRGWRGWSPRLALAALALAGVVLYVANHSLMEPFHYDSGLYHYPAIHWIHAYPIVPGLGLVHGRLAFNQSYFLYVAMLESAPFGRHASWWAEGLILLPLLAQMLLRLARRPGEGESPVKRYFYAILFVPMLAQSNSLVNISSPSPDLPVCVVGIVAAMELLDLILLPPAALRGLRWRILRLVLVCMAGVTMKLNFLVVGFGTAGLALAIALFRLLRPAGHHSPIPHSDNPQSTFPHSAFLCLGEL